MSAKPQLLVFHSTRSGHCRRVEGYLAQVLQRRSNHETFAIRRIAKESRPELFERFKVADAPTLIVVSEKRIRARLTTIRGANDIGMFLAPWLR